MKKTLLPVLILLLTLPGVVAHAADKTAGLEVEVTGIRSTRGDIRLVLFDDAGTYLKTGRGAIVRASAGSVTLRFEDIGLGTYAIAAHHDENGNGEMEAGFFGIPKEGYGFSNNVKGVFGPPLFRDAAFYFGEDATGISIRIDY